MQGGERAGLPLQTYLARATPITGSGMDGCWVGRRPSDLFVYVCRFNELDVRGSRFELRRSGSLLRLVVLVSSFVPGPVASLRRWGSNQAVTSTQWSPGSGLEKVLLRTAWSTWVLTRRRRASRVQSHTRKRVRQKDFLHHTNQADARPYTLKLNSILSSWQAVGERGTKIGCRVDSRRRRVTWCGQARIVSGHSCFFAQQSRSDEPVSEWKQQNSSPWCNREPLSITSNNSDPFDRSSRPVRRARRVDHPFRSSVWSRKVSRWDGRKRHQRDAHLWPYNCWSVWQISSRSMNYRSKWHNASRDSTRLDPQQQFATTMSSRCTHTEFLFKP